MAILQILRYPSKILLAPTRRIETIDGSLENIVKDMLDTMYAAPGVGLAANQIGIPLQIAVIDVSTEAEKRDPRILINPEIISFNGVQLEEEGCLSIPGFSEIVKRPTEIKVSSLDLTGHTYIIEGEGLMARALSHEIDHLNGRLFIYHLSMLKRDFIKRQIKKMMKSGEWPGVIQ